MIREIAVVGASVAGVHCVRALREAGYDGSIRLIGDEAELPYDRPPLSKEYLLGERGPADVLLAKEDYYADHRVDLLLGVRAERISPGGLSLEDGRKVPFDRLFVATGARPVALSIPGAELEGVHYLRTLGDARSLRDAMDSAGSAVIIGCGFIGAEVAAACRAKSIATTLVDLSPNPFERVFGSVVAQALLGLQRENGVDLRLGMGIDGFYGQGRVEGVQLSDGSRLPAQLVIVGVGVRPNVELFEHSGIATCAGVLVDEHLETSLRSVFAGGDCARFPYRGSGIRTEHWDSARVAGEHAARAMLGEGQAFSPTPFFWTDQYGITVQYFGHHVGVNEVVFRGNPHALDFAAFYMEDGQIRAACTAGRPREALSIRRLVQAGARVSPSVLADADTNLRQLAQEFRGA